MRFLAYLFLFLFFSACRPDVQSDLPWGLTYTSEATQFKIWATQADSVKLLLYSNDIEGRPNANRSLTLIEPEVWQVRIPGDWIGSYYAFEVYRDGKGSVPVPDIYAKAVGTNGKRGQIIDLEGTNPPEWSQDMAPLDEGPGTRLIYEMHIRDATIHPAGEAEKPGTFMGLAESPVVLDHIASLGLTHVHLLPFFDFASVDESRLNEPQYNWGYDPLNYNVPEGSYSTNPSDGNVRIRQLKTLVQTMHDKGLRVVMDVVYNHTRFTKNSSFEVFAPGQFFRKTGGGQFSNASGCGNEVASENPMVRSFMIESLKYWMSEYHLDGFRFDLMGIHDIKTMNAIADTLKGLRPDVLLYGEGWKAGDSPISDNELALKVNAPQFPSLGVFSDDLRDGIKGSVFNEHDQGWVQGNSTRAEDVKFGLAGAIDHPQLSFERINYSTQSYCVSPAQMIAYVSCHDNLTLWDKLVASVPNETDSLLQRRHRLSVALVLLSQGTPFLHAGSEFYRTKFGIENSYESPDSINHLRWDLLDQFPEGSSWVRALISFRKEVGIGCYSAAEVAERLSFLDTSTPSIIAFTFSGKKEVLVVINSGYGSVGMKLPSQGWRDFEGVEMGERIVLEGTDVVMLLKS